jgi:hypothetical protein
VRECEAPRIELTAQCNGGRNILCLLTVCGGGGGGGEIGGWDVVEDRHPLDPSLPLAEWGWSRAARPGPALTEDLEDHHTKTANTPHPSTFLRKA